MHWITTTFKRSFDYSGRSRRMEYWGFALFAFVVTNVFGAIVKAMGVHADGPDANPIVGLLGTMMLVAIVVPGLSVAVRRLHDANFAGWWIGLPGVPILGWALIIIVRLNSEQLFLVFEAALVITPIALLILMCLPGTAGPNRFGPDPKSPGLGDTFS